MESILFNKTFLYDTLKTGVTVLAVLKYGDKNADFETKIDTVQRTAFLNANTPKD